MSKRKMQKGVCHLCKKISDLTFEHIPPKIAFNNQTRYQTFPFIEYLENSSDNNYTPTGKIYQGGVGEYCLCKKCNNFLGVNYVKSYYQMALAGQKIFANRYAQQVYLKNEEVSALGFLKQILSMFICINKPEFTDVNPDLLRFIQDPHEKNLPDKFKIYMYLNNGSNFRNITFVYHSAYGLLSEIAFPPLGFVLTVDEIQPVHRLTDITIFKTASFNDKSCLDVKLTVLPTHNSMLPLDFRSKKKISEDNESLKD